MIGWKGWCKWEPIGGLVGVVCARGLTVLSSTRVSGVAVPAYPEGLTGVWGGCMLPGSGVYNTES